MPRAKSTILATFVSILLMLLIVVVASGGYAVAASSQEPPPETGEGLAGASVQGEGLSLAQVIQKKQARTAVQNKISSSVLGLIERAQAQVAAGPSAQMASLADLSTSVLKIDSAGLVDLKLTVDAFGAEQRESLTALGVEIGASAPEYGLVDVKAPWDRIEAVAALEFVRNVAPPGYAVYNTGDVTSAGDSVLGAATARSTYSVDGSGVKVGVMSDGVTHLSASQASSDLPSVQVLQTGSGDEGTAMLEIVHDLAPGADLAFYAPTTSTGMVVGIGALETAGCDVIVDDIRFLDEPVFEDGPIAQEARSIVDNGGMYVTSVGNDAERHYRDNYVRSSSYLIGTSYGHDYDSGAGEDLSNSFTVPAGGMLTAVLQWNNEWGAAGDDFDLLLAEGSTLVAISNDTQDGDDAPWEILQYTNTSGTSETVWVGVQEWYLESAPSSLVLDYYVFANWNPIGLEYGMTEHSTWGHAAVEEVLSTAAAGASTPGTIRSYSSQGTGTIQFPAAEERQVPNITGVDGVNTKTGQLGYFSNPFYGTSAAAPHVAAIAALVWDAVPTLTSSQLHDAITSTAVDLGTAGWDALSGYGRVDAAAAVGAVLSLPVIDDVDPDSGPTTGGTSVTITGENFTGATDVTFGGTAAAFSVDSDTEITATSPSHSAGLVQIEVTTPDGSATAGFTYVAVGAVPTVTGLAPATGSTAGGTSVVITGTNFWSATAVTFGGDPVSSFRIDSDTQITTTSPVHAAGTVQVQVTNPTGDSADTGADDYTYTRGVTVFYDGFESGMGKWMRNESPTWGATTYRSTEGSHSAYCVGSSIVAPGPYPNNLVAAMSTGPLNLSSISSGTLEFDLYLDTEETYDYFAVFASLDSNEYYGYLWDTDTTGWENIVLDLSTWYGPSGTDLPILGDSSVWFDFVFISDGSNPSPQEGAYIDEVRLTSDGPYYHQIKGSDRFDTAMKISQAMYPNGLAPGSGVVLTPGWESYQEALCGAPLAAAWNGPVLLSSKTMLYSGVAAELVRLDPDQVFCIGLTGTTVANAVRALLPGATVTSINGTMDNVYHMSYLVAKKLGERVNATGGDMSTATGIVTIGSNFPDAIGVSPLACYKKWPVLLTNYPDARAMNAYAVQAMNELGITKYVKAGTYAPDPPGIAGLSNFSGADRYYTNSKVAIWAQAYAGLTYAHTGLTTGDKFPDALAGGPYVALNRGTLLLSPLTGPLPTPIQALLIANGAAVERFSYIACIEPVISQVKDCLP